jgi:hypothetical protein
VRTLQARQPIAPARAPTNWGLGRLLDASSSTSLRDDDEAGWKGAAAAAREDPADDRGDGDHDDAACDADHHARDALHGGEVRQDASLLCSLAVENAKAPLDA